MAGLYLDSSALAKRYVAESGSGWVGRALSPAARNEIYTARITGAEVVAALAARARAGTLALAEAQRGIVRFRRDFRVGFQLVDVTAELVESAMDLCERHGLRGYDSVQLASALQIQMVRMFAGLPPLTFVSADTRLNGAARDERLRVEDLTTRR